MILVTILLTRRQLFGGLVQTLRRLPKDFADGKKRIDDPAAAAKPVNAPPRERE